MGKTKRMIIQVGSFLLLSILVAGLVFNYQRTRFIQKANELFDPKEKAFTGAFLPWPIGHPSLFGGLDPKTNRRIRDSLGYESGSISTNGMTLVIRASDGTFFVHAD